ncbi:35840_t:CDS:2, partial [Gigaspora margarita]
FSSIQYSTTQPSIVTTPSLTKEAYASRVSLNSSMNIINSTQLPTSSSSKSPSGSIISNNQKPFLEEKERDIKRMNELFASKMEILKKKVGSSMSHSNIAYHYKRSPPQVLGQFRRAKSSSIFESFRDCKDKENTPPRMPNTPPRMSNYSSPSYSPLSDLSQSPLSSPLKRMVESPITQYFKRADISKTMIKSTLAVSTPKKSGDASTSSEDECDDDSVISSTPCNDSKKRRSTVSISDEVVCLKIKDTKDSSMLISPAQKLGAFKKEKVTVSASVGIRHGSKTHVTPPTKSGITGYFHKMKGKHKK